MEASVQEKQRFLREQILGKQFDAEEFMEFMGRVKGEGENIDLEAWSGAELREVVERYKDHLARGKQELLNSRISRLQHSKILLPTHKEKVKYEGTALWDYEQDDTQECTRAELAFRFPTDAAPKIEIEKAEVKSVGGFIFGIGSRNELEIVIRTNFTEEKVVRKAEDCDWLKTMLTVKHPGCFVPPLEPSRELASDDKKGLAAWTAEAAQFLNSLLDYPCFHYSTYFREFLTQANYKRFHAYKNRESAFAVEKDFLDIETPSGSFTMQLSDRLNQTLKKTSASSQELSALYGEVSKWTGKVTGDMEALHKSIRCLNDATNRLGDKLSEVQAFFHYEDIRLPTMLLSINSSHAILTRNLKAQTKALAEFNESFLRSAVRQWTEFVAFDKRHQGETKSYLSAKEALLRRKEKYCGDPLRWELPEAELQRVQKAGVGKLTREEVFEKMFPSENDKEHRTRTWLSFVHQNYLASFKQFLLCQEKALLTHYLAYALSSQTAAEQNAEAFKAFRAMFHTD